MISTGLTVFLCTLAAGVFLAWVFRSALGSVASAAAENAKTYAGATAKLLALLALALFTQFDDTFSKLTNEQAAGLTWIGWCVLFFKPVAAALTTLVAFLDQSVARASAAKSAKDGGTRPPV